MARIRLDKLIVKRKIATNIDEAHALLEEGQILVNGATQINPASFIDLGASVERLAEKSKYVSRGGFKLEKALEVFSIDISSKRCLDVGASTGGFTDAMLTAGAEYVVAIDVGKGQLDDKIRHHEQVKIFEKFNAKDLTVEAIEAKCEFAAMDVSFTSIMPLMESVSSVLDPIEMVVLLKPQFELPEKYIDSKGIVRDIESHVKAITDIRENLDNNLSMVGLEFSPISGTKGNIEFLAHIVESEEGVDQVSDSRIFECVSEAHATLKKDI